MKTLQPTKTWILICSLIAVSGATEHASPHHDVIQHGDSEPWTKHQNQIVPLGIQMPDHVLSARDLNCISADNNIFEIMNKAQETCNGTDVRCTFYHFLNHDYENIGTLDIDKEKFDDLLMKFDNWLLTAENIEKRGDGKIMETASIGVNDEFSNENSPFSTEIKSVDATQDGDIDKLNLSITESDHDRAHSHHLKIPHGIHPKIHLGKDHHSVTAPNIHRKQSKNENHIILNPEYNTDHKYFEVYIPKDKVTGKPRTIYVEVDQDKNEFVLLDEEIDEKLNGIKPIRIELDELSEIADTAFNEVAKVSNFKKHVHSHLNDDERAIMSDISKHSAVNVDEVHLDIDVGEQTQNSINPSVYSPIIYNIETEQQHKSDDSTRNVKDIINVNKNFIVPNKYINQAQFNKESHIDNLTDYMQNDHFELQENKNTETDSYICNIGSSQSSPDHTTAVKDTTLIQSFPSSSYVIQEPSLITTPCELETTTPMSSKHVLLSKLGLPKYNTDYDRLPTTNPSPVKPCSLKDAVSSPCSIEQILPCLQKTVLSPMDSGFIKKSPCDNISKETNIPCSANSNRYPYTTIPYFLNPYLKPPQCTSYLEPLLQTPLQPAYKIPTLDSVPISLDQSNPCLTGVYPQEEKTIQFLPGSPNSQFSPLNPMLVGPGFLPNALPCRNIWNNIPYLLYTNQNIRNKPPFLSNYLTPTIDQNHKPLPSKTVPVSIVEHPCSSNNLIEITPSSYTPFSLPVHTSQLQKDLHLSQGLERDLESLSLKYGIPLSKILNSLETKVSDSISCLPALEVPNPNFKYDGSLTAQQSHTLSKTNTNTCSNEKLFDSDLINLTPLDSSLIGSHLELENSLDAHNSHCYTILSESTEPVRTPHLSAKNHPTKILHESSLIGPHLSTLCSSNILLSDDNRNRNEVVPTEPHSSNLMSLEASLTGPHLTIGHPPTVLDYHISKGDILTSQTEVPTTSSSQFESKVNQNKPTNLLLDSSLTGCHLQSLSPFKQLLSNEIQSINKMVPLESELADLTPLVLSQVDLTNELEQSSLSSPIQLDSSLVGPELLLGSSPIVTDTLEEKNIHLVQDNLEKTKIKVDRPESIILPSSLLPTLLNEPVQADSNPNIISQDTKLKKELIEVSVDANVMPLKETDFKIIVPVKLDINLNMNTQNTRLNEKLSLDNHLEIPLTDTSHISLKETDFEIIESNPDLHNSNIIPLLSKDSTTLKLIPGKSPVDYEKQLESSLIGPCILPKPKTPVISSTIDSSIQLDHSLVGPSILNEIDSQSPIIETVDQFESSIVATTMDQNIKPIESTTIDSKIPLDSSLIGPTLHPEISSQGTSTVYNSVTPFESSSVSPSLYEAGTKTCNLDTSLIMPSLYEPVKASASSSASIQQDSSLPVTNLKPEMETLVEECRVFDSKKLDSTLVGPHLSTMPFSSDEIKMINKELQQKSELANLIPLDSTLIGPHVNFENKFDQSEICRCQNPELFLTSGIARGILETIDFLNSDFVERHPPKPNTVSSIYQSDLQELLSKFKNSITKSQLSPSEYKPCDKLLSSIGKQSTDNIYMSPSSSDLQTLTWNTLLNTPLSLLDDTASEFSPITLAYPEKELGLIVKGTCLDSNYHSTPQTSAELLSYAQGVPQIPIRTYSPSVCPIKQIIDHNWVPQPINIQNVLQASHGLRPAVGNAPVPSLSNALMPFSPENLKLLDLASQSKTFPQLSIPNISTPIPPSLDWTTLSNILPLENYIPSLPEKNFSILPSNLEFSTCNSGYSPVEVGDIMSILDENRYKLLKDMSILPLSQSSLTPSIPVFEKGKIVSSLPDTLSILYSDFIKTRPVLPISISNAKVPSSIYTNPQIGLYNPQNIPNMIPTPNIPPYNLQPYSITPLDALFSEIVGPVPKIESLPIESSKSSLESQWHEIPNTPQLMESIPNSILDREFLQQLLSKPCLESPIILPSSLLDTMSQLSKVSSKSKSFPCQSPPVSPVLTTPLSNAFTSPVLPMYANPLSVSYAKPILGSSSRLPLNMPYAASPLTSLPISPYTVSSVRPDFSTSLRPLKSTSLSNYPIAPAEIYNRPIPSTIPCKPSQMYSTPYLQAHPSPLPVENSPYSLTFMNKLATAQTSPISPVFYESLTAPYFSPEPKPKTLTNFGTTTYSGSLPPVSPIPMASSSTGVLPPSYISSDLSTYKYSPISAPVNTLTQPSSTLSPAYMNSISPVSSIFPSYNRPLPSKPTFNLKPEITPEELENLRLLNTLPFSNANNPFLNANQMLLTSSNILPLQKDHAHVPKSSPFFSSQMKQIKPSEDKIGSNLQTRFISEETPCEIIEENMYSYSNDKDMIYEKPNFKYPLESLSCTLAPEEIKETLPTENFIKQGDHIPCVHFNSPVTEPSLQPKFYQRPHTTSFTPLYGKPCLAPQLFPQPSPVETIPQNIFDDVPLVSSTRPLNPPTSLQTSILTNPLLKPLAPLFTPGVNLSLMSSPCINTYLSPYKILPIDKKPLFSSPYYFAPNQDMLAPPINPRGQGKIISPQVTSTFSKVSANSPFVPFSSPTTSPTLPYYLDNYIELPLTYNEPKSKEQGILIKPFTVPSYNQYAATTVSHISPIEMPISFQYITPLTPAKSLKKPLISPQYISSILPAQTKLQQSCPLNKASLNYQPYIPLPTEPSNAAKNTFKSLLVTSPYTMIPTIKMVEPMSTNLNSPQWSSFTPQYSLSSSPVSKSSPVNSLSNVKYSTNTPDVAELPMTNHIIPSSLFKSSDTDFQITPLKKLTPLQSIPRYSYPSPTLMGPLQIVPYETPKNIFKLNTQYYNRKYPAVPLSSSPYLTQPLEIIDSFQTQPIPNIQYTNKSRPKFSPILAQDASASLAPSYTSLPLETVPNLKTNKPRVPQYSLANVPTYEASIQPLALYMNPLLNTDFKLITKVPSYPVPNNQISSLKLTPYESILLSNLTPLGISKEALESNSAPITFSTPLSSSPLLKPLAKILTQKSSQYEPQMIPINSQYVSQSQSDVPQLPPSTSPILKSPLLKPLMKNFQNYSPSLPNYLSNLNIAFSESCPMKSLPSVSSIQKYSTPSKSLVSELPETLKPITSYSFLKPSFYKHYQSPVTKTNMPIYSNYNVQESSPYLPIKGNYMNTVKPIEASAISTSESSRVSLDSLASEIVDEMVPCELRPDLKDKLAQLSLNLNQKRQFYPALALPQPTRITSASSKYKTARPRPFSVPSVIPEDVELIDTTDFIPISPIRSEALTSTYSPTDRKAPILNTLSNIPESNTFSSSPYTVLSNTDFSPSTFKPLPPKSIPNTQSIQEPDISQFFPYTILSNSHLSPPISKHLPPTIQKQLYNQRPQSSPIYLSPQEYEELTKSQSSSQALSSSSSSPIALPSTNIGPQLITNSLPARQIPLTPLYASPISKPPENLLQLPLFGKYSPFQETPIEITPEKVGIQSLSNKYRPFNKISPLGLKSFPYEPKSSIVELLTELKSVKSVNPLNKSKESYVQCIEDLKSNDENDYVKEEYVSLDENKPDVFEAKSVTKSLVEIIKGVNAPNYYNDNNEQRPQRLSKLDHFYANNHIGKDPQVCTVPAFNTSPVGSSTDGERSSTIISPESYKDFTVIPIKHFGSVPKLDTSSRCPEYYPDIANCAEIVPFTNSYNQNYINPSLKSYSQMKLPTNAIEVIDTSEIPSSSYNPINNINDIKYSGYKTYQIPSLKSPKTVQNLGPPSHMYSSSSVSYSPINLVGKPSSVHQIPRPSDLYVPTEIDEPINPQYQAPKKLTSPFQTKLGLETVQKSPDFNDYGTIEDESVCIDDIIEDNELKSSLINYINRRNDIKNNLDNNNQELTIPIGNIAIIKKEPYNADTIETNNPSIGLKVWKSNVKIAEAELKLKFKDLSVINFMPVVNNLDKYDMEEIRKIVKNYIDDKYGNHIEINEPYTVDNQYTVIKDFDPNAVSNKYNLLWPTNYV